MRFRVVSWNIHKGIGGLDRRYRIERISELLSSFEVDFALLQEVASDLPRAGHHAQVELLAEALGLAHTGYFPQHAFVRGGYGNAILSRHPLTDLHEIDLTIGTRKKRGALLARARMRHGRHTRSLLFCSLHLGLAGSERGEQLGRFLASEPFRGLHRRTPIVLGGDLNDLYGTLGPRFLEPEGFRRAGGLVNTFPAWLPLRPLDGVFVRGDARVVGAGAPSRGLARVASDHLPVVVDVELRGRGR
ncbi:MAG: endonuclease/exonuclease/phosphatase family protein [Polyangiaceae bacterium]